MDLTLQILGEIGVAGLPTVAGGIRLPRDAEKVVVGVIAGVALYPTWLNLRDLEVPEADLAAEADGDAVTI